MRINSQLSFAAVAALALGLAACGGDKKDKTSKLECTSNSQCAERTDGKTECDLIHNICVEPADMGQCDGDADCAERTDGRTKCDTTLHLCTTPSTSSCTRDDECASQLCGDDHTCRTVKMVDCDKNVPEHAIVANDALKVAVNFDGTNWEAPAVCPWTCDSNGYQLNEAKTGCEPLPGCTEHDDCRSKVCDQTQGVCANTKTDHCWYLTDAELEAVNATDQDKTVQVTWTFVEYNDGSSEWLHDKCPITECKDQYEVNDAKDACHSTVDACGSDEDCADNAEKTYCDIPEGQNSGTCIEPECRTNEDCAESPVGPFCHNYKCDSACWYDTDCANDAQGRTVCSSYDFPNEDWVCITPCNPNECSEDGKGCNSSGHLVECTGGRVCDGGACIVPVEDTQCAPACTDGKICMLHTNNNTDPTNYTYSCDYQGAQLKDVSIRIAQVYLGDASNGATPTYNRPFIELYNYGTTDIDLSSMSLIYLTKAGSFNNSSVVHLGDTCSTQQASCTIKAGRYFRIENRAKVNQNSGADVNGTIHFNKSIGMHGSYAIAKTASVPSSDIHDCNDAKQISYDLVGLGDATCFEGERAAHGVDEGNTATKGYMRDDVTTDTDSSYDDFSPTAPVLH